MLSSVKIGLNRSDLGLKYIDLLLLKENNNNNNKTEIMKKKLINYENKLRFWCL